MTNGRTGSGACRRGRPLAGDSFLRSWPRAVAAVFVVMLAVVVGAGCKDRSGARTGGRSGVDAAHDARLTDTARLLAGMMPEHRGAFARVTAVPVWQAHHREIDADWARSDRARFAPMRAWRDAELRRTGPCGTLMYPFSGPDILNAYLLFPTCQRYVMFGLEHVGDVPRLDRLSESELQKVVADLRHATADMFERNYFITKRMESDVDASELRGTFPVLLMFLARLDARIVSAQRMEIGPGGTLRPQPARGLSPGSAPALQIVFVAPDGRRQSLVYFRAQAEDRALYKHPGVIKYLDSVAPYTTFLKSASYLLHDQRLFATLRSCLLRHSRVILQDDSGVPFRYLPRADWDVALFGQYARPVKDFNYGFQPDLEAAYARPGAARPLLFSFGYHWQAGSSGVMLAKRKASSVVHSSR